MAVIELSETLLRSLNPPRGNPKFQIMQVACVDKSSESKQFSGSISVSHSKHTTDSAFDKGFRRMMLYL